MVSEAGGERLRRAHFKALKERKILTSRRDFDLGSTESLPTGVTLPPKRHLNIVQSATLIDVQEAMI